MTAVHAPLLVALLVACVRGGAPAGRAATPEESTGSRPGRTLDSSDVSTTTVARVEELFAGRFPGVRVTRTATGELAVQIRGATSLTGASEPLFVVNGMPIEPGTGGLIAINPRDVARIEVLKDIGQTSFYGARGANGVIVITTKGP